MSGRSSKSSKARSKSTFAPTPIGLRELLDASPDAIFCCDLEGRWNWLSPAIESFTGQKPGDSWITSAPRSSPLTNASA